MGTYKKPDIPHYGNLLNHRRPRPQGVSTGGSFHNQDRSRDPTNKNFYTMMGLEFFRSLIHPVSVCIFSRCLWLGPLSAPSSSGHSHARGGTAGRKNVAWILVLTPAAPQPGARCNLLNFLTLQPAASSCFCVFLSLELLASWSLLRLELLLIYSLSSRVPLVFRWESL